MRYVILLIAVTAWGQSPLPCDAPERRQFDFWIGSWAVKTGNNTVGQSVVERELNGCLLVENWYGADGDRGKSLNWYEPATKKWRQVYVGLAWHVEYTGEWRDGALRFEGKQRRTAGAEIAVRLTFTPLPDHRAKQHKERLAGDKWVDVYEFTYAATNMSRPEESSVKMECKAPEQRQFDFWIGDWNVFGPKGRQVGTNRIDKVVNGCVLFENWTGAQGGAGKSFNFYDTQRKQWRQIWVSPQGSLNFQGEWRDGALRYTGQTPGAGGITEEKLTFTPNADGTVRQYWEQSKDGGKTWTVAFDGKYVKK